MFRDNAYLRCTYVQRVFKRNKSAITLIFWQPFCLIRVMAAGDIKNSRWWLSHQSGARNYYEFGLQPTLLLLFLRFCNLIYVQIRFISIMLLRLYFIVRSLSDVGDFKYHDWGQLDVDVKIMNTHQGNLCIHYLRGPIIIYIPHILLVA